jgi:rhamnosyltransferase subunit B
MKVVVTSFGSAGDFNPLLAIAAALLRRGVDVTFVANPFYEARVRKSGCRFVGAGSFFDVSAALEANPKYIHSRAGALSIWRELVVPSIREIYPVVLATVRDMSATAVVSHFIAYGGAWAAIKARVRSIVVTTSPSAWLSRHEPMVFGNWRAPRLVQGWLTWTLRGVGGLVAQRPLARLAAELGAPPVADIVHAADLNLGVWPEWFRRCAPDDPPRSQSCGFVFDREDPPPSLRRELAEFLASGDPPVIVGFGSAASLHAAQRYRTVAEACGRLGQRCLLIGASANVVAASAQVMAVDTALYAHVFPAASAVVHHGGFGTCGEALRAGKPSLVTPFAFDQFDTAARVADTGFGRWLRGNPTDAGAVAAELSLTLRDASLANAVRQAAAKIAAAPGGAERAAELIERL